MLIKEYRICLPMTVEEYRIAQLYMIQKKSREESTGEGSGVEILTNEPYEDGPGGKGQYTFKIYHVGSHLPAWFRNILPSSALRVEEEAWNAYPYTKTRYKVPFVERFMLEIETRYCDDSGEQANVFQLSSEEVRQRQIDYLDMVRDPIPPGDYRIEEDPKKYVSIKTRRGPLEDNWREEYKEAQQQLGKQSTKRIMCAYKLCRVEFRYWGMQSKIERFIDDVALRKTMLRAHRQAWCWQDEWHGLTIEDIRELERETARKLALRMADASGTSPTVTPPPAATTTTTNAETMLDNKLNLTPVASSSCSGNLQEDKTGVSASLSSDDVRKSRPVKEITQMDWNLQSLENLQRYSSDEDDNFYDAEDRTDPETMSYMTCHSAFSTLRRSLSLDDEQHSQDNASSNIPQRQQQQRSYLILVVHGGSLLDTSHEYHNKNVDVSNFRNSLESVLRSHYSHMIGKVVVRLVACPPVVTNTLHTIASLSPLAFETQGHLETVLARDFIPLGAIPLFFSSSATYDESLELVCSRLNHRYSEYIRSEGGGGIDQHPTSVILVGDSAGSIIAYDILCRLASTRHTTTTTTSTSSSPSSTPPPSSSTTTTKKQFHLDFTVSEFFMLGSPLALVIAFRNNLTTPTVIDMPNTTTTPTTSSPDATTTTLSSPSSLLSSPPPSSSSSSQSPGGVVVTSPLPETMKPNCDQVYNLFHLIDPCSFRLEPLLYTAFRHVAPIHVWRYSRFELPDDTSSRGDRAAAAGGGENNELCHYVTDALQQHSILKSTMDNFKILQFWWGQKRIDYGLHCPEALKAFPVKALPHLLHSSYWESVDVAAFILRQVIGTVLQSGDFHTTSGQQKLSLVHESQETDSQLDFSSSLNSSKASSSIRNRLRHQKNSFKIKSASPNHRANDVIVLVDAPQELYARFIYGPLDVMPLTGESVDVYLMPQPPSGSWEWVGQEVTDSSGKVRFHVPESRRLPPGGIYPVRMAVQAGDRSAVEFSLAVVHPNTDVVVFSVDGSFAASVSLMGKDPKVRAGGVDVARHWQELGYLIIYISARPAMQHRRVVNWMAQHNFPHGMCIFSESLNTEPIRKKACQLQRIVQSSQLRVHCGYGSAKDIPMYRDYLQLSAERIFVLGVKGRKGNRITNATTLTEGYAMHLTELRTTSQLSRPACNPLRCVQRRTTFQLNVGRSRLGGAANASGAGVASGSSVDSHSLNGIGSLDLNDSLMNNTSASGFSTISSSSTITKGSEYKGKSSSSSSTTPSTATATPTNVSNSRSHF